MRGKTKAASEVTSADGGGRVLFAVGASWPAAAEFCRWTTGAAIKSINHMRVILVGVIAVLAFGFTAIAQEIAGIGVDFTQRTNEPVKAFRIHPGSPAEQAGIKPGGFLISVDGTNVVNMSLTQAVKMVRGPAGTPVTIELADTNMTHTNTFKIKRSRIVIVDNEFKFIDH